MSDDRQIKGSKSEIIAELFAMASQHLSGPWPGDLQTADIWHKKLIPMKLVEPVEGRRDEHRNTALGNEVHVDLMMVFLGSWDLGEVPDILYRHNLMSEQEMRDIWARIDAGERDQDMLPPYVLRAFRQYFKIPTVVN